MNRKALPRRNPSNPVIREYDRAVTRGQKSVHVVPHESGWSVKRVGASKGNVYETKERAVDVAHKRAKRDRVELFIHGRDGRIRERNSYGPDPFPPRG
jgi:hypothetical protein